MNAPDSFELEPSVLRHPDSAKWTNYSDDVLPLWVADMDFAIAPSIQAALIARLSHGVGYHALHRDTELPRMLREKMQRLGLRDLPADGWHHFVSGVVQGLYASVLGLTAPGDEVLTMIPIYPPFLGAITDHGRIAKHAPLRETVGGWEIDFDAMVSAVTSKTRLLLLCHPHNPTGRLWTIDELSRVAEFAERHDLYVASDELHADLTLDGIFTPFASVASPALRMKTITLTGPCKTYNTAGLGIGAIISHNPELITRLKKSISGISGHPGALSVTMWQAALRDDGAWLSNVLQTLRGNRDFLATFVRERLPGVSFFPPQATYLAWLDYRAHPRSAEIQKFLLDRAKVALNPGPIFGPGYNGFVRLNFATSRSILSDALERMARVHGG